jgi:transposase
MSSAIDPRQQRGLEIAAMFRIVRKDGGWVVPSSSGKGRYTVTMHGDAPTCTCADYEERGQKCKHVYAVEFVIRRETVEHENDDGTTTVTESVTVEKRTTYAQDWPAYNAAQVNEQDHFQELLRDLCAPLVTPARKTGRRPLPLSDAAFAVVFKVYSTFSGRRFASDLREAVERGYLARAPHYNSVFNYLEDEALTPVLLSLITESSKPLAAVECDFAADSTGFTASRFARWYDVKYNCLRLDHDWVKAHVMCGVKTNVVTAVEIHDKRAHDAPQLPALLATTAANFRMREVSADKGYSSVASYEAIAAHGAAGFVPFKAGHTGTSGGLWTKMFHYFNFRRDEFLGHYHKRSNVESTFAMVKAKFGDAVRSKTDVAMRNEVLCKFVAHNICCLISAFYELGIESDFWGGGSRPAVA